MGLHIHNKTRVTMTSPENKSEFFSLKMFLLLETEKNALRQN